MEEKILIESKLCKKWFLLPVAILLIGILIFTFVNGYLSVVEARFAPLTSETHTIQYEKGMRCSVHFDTAKDIYTIHPTLLSYKMCLFNFRFFDYNFKDKRTAETLKSVFILIVIPLAIIAFLFYILIRKNKLVITDKRAYGKTIFGQRVDLPMDSISAIGTGVLKSMYIGTSSGRIRFSFIENCDEIHSVVSELLTKRQQNEEKSQSADELKKYKELLDSGIITQEEFDTKKKQILGL